MSSIWIDERINKIFSHVRNKVKSALKDVYPDLTFTQDDSENAEAHFPTVYMFFDFAERGTTLDGGAINAVLMTVRTRISVTKTQGNNAAREVNAKVRDELISYGFIASGSPIPTVSGDVKVINSNYQRVIGFNDPI
jgi:hypothetical protein